jgi:hypothetical protein
MIMGVANPKILIDHEDGDGLNNQKYNLRECNFSENGCNRKRVVASSGFIGVYKNDRGAYKAVVWKDRKAINIGTFENALDAAKARDAAAKVHQKGFATLNFGSEITIKTNCKN